MFAPRKARETTQKCPNPTVTYLAPGPWAPPGPTAPRTCRQLPASSSAKQRRNEMTVVRVAFTQATWTGDKESMIAL
ncbi:MAG TPA: hypothetical protein VHA75_04265, partial [Rugosimonospora sp.]|nr:hypothetical protein [Rugosimonospora sp.]